MSAYDEERLADLLAALPPAPRGWVEAAQELPVARRELDDIVSRAIADQEFRKAVLADLEAALASSGLESDPVLVAALRARLSEGAEET
jgi:hypothetical protein